MFKQNLYFFNYLFKMKKQEIILNLIQQDLKHNQLVIGLDKLGLEGSDIHNLRILEMVSNLI